MDTHFLYDFYSQHQTDQEIDSLTVGQAREV